MPHPSPTQLHNPALTPKLTPAFRLSLSLALSALLALLLSYSVACIRFAHAGSDPAWLLYAAARVLSGLTLYGPRITESNPPLIVWFSILPNLLAHWLHASPLLILKLLVTAMALASAAWSVRILHAAKLATSPLLLCLSFCAITAAEVSRDFITFGQFTQREQLVILLALPYLLYAASAAKLNLGTPERIALGIAAGIGICLKPQQLLLLLAIELFLLLGSRDLRRLLRPELLAFTLIVCAYALLVFLATPYFTHMVPLLKDTYWAFADTPKLTLARTAFLNAKFLLALILCLAASLSTSLSPSPSRYLKYPAAPAALLAASLGAGLAYIQQGTAWSYHLFPSTVLLVSALAWIALDLLSTLFSNAAPTTPRQTLTLAAVTLILFALSLPAFLARERRQVALDAKYRSDLSILLASYPPQTPVYVFSTSLGEFSAIVENHLVWTSRYNHLWMLPALVENERALAGGPPARMPLSPDRLSELADKQRSDTAEDLHLGKPTYVIVDHCTPETPCQALGPINFDILQWFLKSPAFAAEWSHYPLQSTHPAFAVYHRLP
jgi:hypothetical protein